MLCFSLSKGDQAVVVSRYIKVDEEGQTNLLTKSQGSKAQFLTDTHIFQALWQWIVPVSHAIEQALHNTRILEMVPIIGMQSFLMLSNTLELFVVWQAQTSSVKNNYGIKEEGKRKWIRFLLAHCKLPNCPDTDIIRNSIQVQLGYFWIIYCVYEQYHWLYHSVTGEEGLGCTIPANGNNYNVLCIIFSTRIWCL